MKAYFSLLYIRFLHGLQYRGAALSGIFTQFAWGMLEILMFHAFYEANPNAFPMDFRALASYIWLQQAFLALYATWYWEKDIFHAIQTGDIAYSLCRPVSLYGHWYATAMASRLSKATLRSFPILGIALFLPAPYSLHIPSDITTMCMFLLSFVLAFLLVLAIEMTIYIITFYLIDSQGIKMVYTSLSEFLTGAIIPLPFLPLVLQKWVNLLPFASLQNVPFRIFGGEMQGDTMLFSISLQCIWLLVFYLLGKVMLSHILKRIMIQGG